LDLENVHSLDETTQIIFKNILLNANKEFDKLSKLVEKICNTLEIIKIRLRTAFLERKRSIFFPMLPNLIVVER